MDLSKARDTFLQEAHELLQQFESLLLQAESNSLGDEELNALFRTAHTIKGSAGLFGFDAIVNFTHTVENVLDCLRNRTLVLDRGLTELLFLCRDSMLSLVDALERAPEMQQMLSETELNLQLRLQSYLEPTSLPISNPVVEDVLLKNESQRWKVKVRFGSNVMRDGVDPIACLRYLSTLGNISEMKTSFHDLPELSRLDPENCHAEFDFIFTSDVPLTEIESTFDFAREGSDISISPYHEQIAAVSVDKKVIPSLGKAREGGERKPPGEGRFLKVEASKLDHLINLVGELVIAGASANLLATSRSDAAMQEVVSVMSTLVEQIRDGALTMRMVPIGEIFQRFPRVVRDVSHDLGKDIELQISGEETELDKSMVEKLTDPLMHILRNALDHGIESAERRKQAGKAARGVISLTAYHESGSIVIEVEDDGCGISREKVLNKARERGLIDVETNLTDEQVFQLLFQPGFSTADKVTNLSGRGVGMDVVKKNIEMLRGEIEVESVEGKGTTMRLRLPLTLAIIDGFLVEIGSAHFVIPLDMVQECIELQSNDYSQGNFMELRGEVLPYIDMRTLYGETSPRPRWCYVVVVQYGNRRSGLVVDQLHGELQVVIKPLGKLFRSVRGLGGSAILGSGEVALILDVPQLVQLAANKERHQLECRMRQHAGREVEKGL